MDIQRMFRKFGEVETAELVRDKLNNRSIGRAYVEMPVQEEGEQAIAQLHKTELKGKVIAVSKMQYDPAPNNSWSFSSNV